MFSPSRKQHNNKESLATDLFEQLNSEQSFLKAFFKGTPSCKTSQKITYAKSRHEELETETEILRERDRDLKKRVSRPRPSLETPSLTSCIILPPQKISVGCGRGGSICWLSASKFKHETL